MSFAFVLDCSAALPWIFGDEASEATDHLLNELVDPEKYDKALSGSGLMHIIGMRVALQMVSAPRKTGKIDEA